MLYGAKQELESATRVQLLTIRQRELDFFLQACRYVAQLSAFVAGFAYTALVYATKYVDMDICDTKEMLCASMNYPFFLTLCMGLSFYCLWGAMLITLLAPAMALRGPQGSLQKCVDIIVQEYQCTLFVFVLSVIMLMICTAVWAMTQNLMPVAVMIIGLISALTLYLIYLTSAKTLRRFDAPNLAAVSNFRLQQQRPPPTQQQQQVRPMYDPGTPMRRPQAEAPAPATTTTPVPRRPSWDLGVGAAVSDAGGWLPVPNSYAPISPPQQQTAEGCISERVARARSSNQMLRADRDSGAAGGAASLGAGAVGESRSRQELL